MKSRNILLLLILIICAVIVGALIAQATKNVAYLSWLGYAKSFGLNTGRPALIDLSVLKIAFGFEISICVAQVICLLGAVLLYRRIR